MPPLLNKLLLIFSIGVGATLVMDAWLMLLQRFGVATLNFAYVGRWVGHIFRGQFRHKAIAKSAPVQDELALGWLMHYATGIAFAGVLIGVQGMEWALQPTWLPALAMGVLTVLIPLLIIQPAMGSGIASSKTATPLKNCLKSLVTHSVFGLGLYLALKLAAWLIA
ncbi:MAG: DUF2938 domain-containing protein [Pseudomonas sp.]|jgi:hypothetical protein|uniref:DUF2938 domain-containing protein n=1 Tax=Pseudomonas sp. TaxID=306 RepID=UPI00398207A7